MERRNERKKSVHVVFQVARPSTVFVVVDVQNDFISGSLAIINCPAGQDGKDVSSKGHIWV